MYHTHYDRRSVSIMFIIGADGIRQDVRLNEAMITLKRGNITYTQ